MSTRTKAPRRNPYETLTASIIDQLENGTVAPWHKPWTAAGTSFNAATGRPYRGINVLVTAITSLVRGYSLPGWVTFKQANEIAAKAARAAGFKTEFRKTGKVRGTWVFASGPNAGKSCGGICKGQNAASGQGATQIAFWGSFEREANDGERSDADGKVSGRFLKTYAVFNVEQCDDAVRDFLAIEPPQVGKTVALKACEAICHGWPEVAVSHGGGAAFYLPRLDTIQLPARASFESPAHYYATRFHEMGHATGAAHRLNRDGIAKFDFKGSHRYAAEELVAEFTSCFLCAEAKIGRPTIDNGVAYLKHWASKLRDDPKILIFAAQRAQKAADLILNRSAAATATAA